MKQHVNLLKKFIFSYRIIDRITEFSFIIFFRFYTFYGAFYFVYSGLSSVIFLPLPIIYCILLSVCHFFNNKPVRARVQFLVLINPIASFQRITFTCHRKYGLLVIKRYKQTNSGIVDGMSLFKIFEFQCFVKKMMSCDSTIILVNFVFNHRLLKWCGCSILALAFVTLTYI